MVAIAAGSYVIGCDPKFNQRKCWDDETPAQKVTLSDYAIMQHEVTVAEYASCVMAGKCSRPGRGTGCTGHRKDLERAPINCVSWAAAKDYCEHRGWRLPSEPEWEAAARGKARTDFPWGNAQPSCEFVAVAASGCDSQGPAAVGSHSKDKSWAEVYDMGGNVREWTADDYQAYQGGKADPDRKGGKVNRGGSFAMKAAKFNAAHTRGVDPADTIRPTLGFRCAVNL